MSYVHTENEGGSHSGSRRGFHSLDRAVKEFILACQFPIATAGSLPGKERRNSLEELTWKTVQEAIEFAKAQEDPMLRLLALRVISSITRTELVILHEQDQAAVDELQLN